VSITFERNLSKLAVERTLYTVFDFLSDVGGLVGIITAALYVVVNAWNFNALENMISANLFKMKRPDCNDSGKSSEAETIKLERQPACKDLLLRWLPKCCHVCKLTRKERVLKQARGYLKKEINIIQIVRMRRYMMRAFKELLPWHKRAEIRKNVKFYSIVADSGEPKLQR